MHDPLDVGEQRTPVTAVQHGYSFNSTAKEMGFRDGDLIVGADDKTYTYLDNAQLLRDLGKAKVIHVLRDGRPTTVNVDGRVDLLKMLKEQPPFVALTLPSIVDSAMTGSPAAKAGVRPGDSIVAINGKAVTTWNQIDEHLGVVQDRITAAQGKIDPKWLATTLVVKHRGATTADTLRFSLTPRGKTRRL